MSRLQLRRNDTYGTLPTPGQMLEGEPFLNFHEGDPFLAVIDRLGTPRRLDALTVSTAPPPNPTDGLMWLDVSGSNPVLWVYVGGYWILPVADAVMASPTRAGKVKVGAGLAIAADGTLMVTGGGGTTGGYLLPPATDQQLGGIKVGAGLTAQNDGTLSLDPAAQYTLPRASVTRLGGVQIGVGLNVDAAGLLSVDPSVGGAYVLPTAGAAVLGGVKVGSGLSVAADGTLSVIGGGSGSGWYVLPAAAPGVLGGIKIGSGLQALPDGTTSVNLPPATANLLGGVMVGSGLRVSAAGVLSVNLPAAGPVDAGVVKLGRGLVANGDVVDVDFSLGSSSTGTVSAVLADLPLQVQDATSRPHLSIRDATTLVKGATQYAKDVELPQGGDDRSVTPGALQRYGLLDERLKREASRVTNWNQATDSGFWQGANAANAPIAGAVSGVVVRMNGTNVLQAAFSRGASGVVTEWRRFMVNGAWQPWTPAVPPAPVDATQTVKGIVELATDAETGPGLRADRAVTPANLAALGLTNGKRWSETGETVTNWNTATLNGFYTSADTAQNVPLPIPGTWAGMVMGDFNPMGKVVQLLTQVESGGQIVWFERCRLKGAWGSWQRTLLSVDEMDSRYVNTRQVDDFQPTVYGHQSAGICTYSVQSGRARYLGDVVHIDIRVVWTNHSGTGKLVIGNLPYKSATRTALLSPLTVRAVRTAGTSTGQVLGKVSANNNTLRIEVIDPSGQPSDLDLPGSGDLAISGTYWT